MVAEESGIPWTLKNLGIVFSDGKATSSQEQISEVRAMTTDQLTTHKNEITCFTKSILSKRNRARNGGSMFEVLARNARNIPIRCSA